ncbi:hypothetical protein DMO16_12780 [Fictibacillus sp. S7]|nr:hypothetical protein DMO16_12780 [Fictibacillus sp. S7]
MCQLATAVEDFYCDEVLSGNTEVEKVWETEHTLAYYHARPFYEVHIVGDRIRLVDGTWC